MRVRLAWIVACLVAAVSLVAATTVGDAAATPRAAADQSYADPGGDAGAGTDIIAVTVRNDPASGAIAIQVASASPIVANHAVAIFIDADRNQSTGSDGDDYWMFGGPMTGVAFFAWNGSSFVRASPPSFSVGAVGANASEFRFNRADIGNVAGFNFAAVSISIDSSSVKFWDVAPDRGYYSYELAAPPPPPPPPAPAPPPVVVKPVIGTPVIAPTVPVAGKRLTVTFAVTRSDDGQPLTSGTMVCDPSVAGKVIAHAESFKSGTARLSFLVPKTAKGKLLKVKLTIKTETQSATRIATFRVK